MRGFNLPDDWNQAAFESHWGESKWDDRPEPEDVDIDSEAEIAPKTILTRNSACLDCGEEGDCAPNCHQRTDSAPRPVVLMRRMPGVQCVHMLPLYPPDCCADCKDAEMERNIAYWLERSSL